MPKHTKTKADPKPAKKAKITYDIAMRRQITAAPLRRLVRQAGQPRKPDCSSLHGAAEQKWLIDRQNHLPSIWNSLSIVCLQSSCSKSMGYW
jgi:hypothetical protein